MHFGIESSRRYSTLANELATKRRDQCPGGERMGENRFDAAAHARSMRDGGFWIDKSFDEFLQQTVAATPGKLALLADRADRAEARRFTYAELGDLVARAAAALKRLGIGPGDVIS